MCHVHRHIHLWPCVVMSPTDPLIIIAYYNLPISDGLVVTTVREYFDLDNAKWLNEYNGPVRLIRRTQDEMIAL